MKASLGGRAVAVAFLWIFASQFCAPGKERPEVSLGEIQKILSEKKFVDLTHAFAPGIPRWSGFPDEQRQTLYWYDKKPGMMGEGFFAELFTHVGQWGTHVDPPAHFIKGLRTVDQIELKEMILPLVCIDVHQECEKNPDYTLSLERVKKWEGDHGQIPAGAFVAIRTDWSKRWPDAARMANKDGQGVAHYPGWSLPALKCLFEERKITAPVMRPLTPILASQPPRTITRLRPTFLAPITIKSSCSRISIGCRNPAPSSSAPFRNQKAVPDSRRGCLPFCRNPH